MVLEVAGGHAGHNETKEFILQIVQESLLSRSLSLLSFSFSLFSFPLLLHPLSDSLQGVSLPKPLASHETKIVMEIKGEMAERKKEGLYRETVGVCVSVCMCMSVCECARVCE